MLWHSCLYYNIHCPWRTCSLTRHYAFVSALRCALDLWALSRYVKRTGFYWGVRNMQVVAWLKGSAAYRDHTSCYLCSLVFNKYTLLWTTLWGSPDNRWTVHQNKVSDRNKCVFFIFWCVFGNLAYKGKKNLVWLQNYRQTKGNLSNFCKKKHAKCYLFWTPMKNIDICK